MKPTFIKLIAGVIVVILGLFLIGLGLIVAIFAGSDWLFLSLLGALIALTAGYFLFFEAKRIKQALRQSATLHVKSHMEK